LAKDFALKLSEYFKEFMSVTINQSIFWDWNQSNQSELFFNEITRQLFFSCLPSDNNCWKNYTGLPLGLSYGCLTALSQITLIGEQLIKGLGSILGCLIPDSELNFHIGWSHLNHATKNSLYLLVEIPLTAINALLIIPIMTFFSPDYTRDCYTSQAPPVEASSAFSEKNSFNDNDVLTEFVF
jgi:hypothetical protein